jgi:glycosyltransferase involved in cell wall biosynthesis
VSSSISLPHRLWRLLPAERRRSLLARAAAFVSPSIEPVPPAQCPGVVVVGELSRASGLGEAARLMLRAAGQLGVPNWPLDVGALLPAHSEDMRHASVPLSDIPSGAAALVHVNAPWLPFVLARLPRGFAKGRRIVGCWAWELEAMPPDWRVGARFVHEAWAPSAFTAAALETILPGRVRSVALPLAADPPVPAPMGRGDFGWPADAVVTLCGFNLASSFERKNPLAAIAAFRQAFGERADRLLVLKVGNPAHAPEDFERLRGAVGSAPNIRIETRTLPRAEAAALTAAADIVLSLHRSEGFGLVPAEAMLLGRPVVATAWSGNLDFMSDECAALVPCTLVPARDERAVYSVPGARWAEPDIGVAAAWLVRLADDPALRARMGAAAGQAARTRLGTAPVRAALAAIGAPLAP